MKTSDSLHPLLLLLSFLTSHNLIFMSHINKDAFLLSICLYQLFHSLAHWLPRVTDPDLEARSSGMIQCHIVYLSTRPDFQIVSNLW